MHILSNWILWQYAWTEASVTRKITEINDWTEAMQSVSLDFNDFNK